LTSTAMRPWFQAGGVHISRPHRGSGSAAYLLMMEQDVR
jgi:hypothetical protein